MKIVLKATITFVLSILILSNTLIREPSSIFNDPGYGICNIGCNTADHHSNAHKLTKCVDKETKINYQACIDFLFEKSHNLFLLSRGNIGSGFTLFNLYSRPPPSIL